MTEKKIRVFLLDEQLLVRAGIRLLIESYPGFEVVGEAARYSELAPLDEAPDIVLMDINSLDQQEVLTAIPQLLGALSHARILLLADKEDQEATLKALRLGAMGIINKYEPADLLIKAMERIYAGEVWINRAMMAQVIGGLWQVNSKYGKMEDPEAIKISLLTHREREVVTLIGEGLRNKQIAERLFISEITVRHHLTSVFDKLEVSDRFELAIYSYRHGLAKLPL